MAILIYCVGMLIVCSGIGLLPLVICESKKTINIISLYGAGLLVGVAFVFLNDFHCFYKESVFIIIPEASATLYQSLTVPVTQNKLSDNSSEMNSEQTEKFCKIMGLSIMAGFLIMYLINHLFAEEHDHSHHNHEADKEAEMGVVMSGYKRFDSDDEEIIQNNSDHSSLINRNKSKNKNEHQEQDLDKSFENLKNNKEKSRSNLHSAFVTLIGLVVHSVADGVSFGCVSYAENAKNENMFQLVIFFAIIMHKIPSAIGFCSFMMSLNIPRNKIVQYLITYTSAPPLSSVVVYYSLSLIGNKLWKADNMMIVGIFLLISAGSFIYVALLHILPEVVSNCKEASENGKSNSSYIGKNLQALLMVLGCCTPFLLYLVHDG